jgi:hypothetical protein
MMDQHECLEVIASGEADAYDLLKNADPRFLARFKRLDNTLVKLLADVQAHFPDACYYTASGGFTLMLGPSHADDRSMTGQQQLIALSGNACIGDGDF